MSYTERLLIWLVLLRVCDRLEREVTVGALANPGLCGERHHPEATSCTRREWPGHAISSVGFLLAHAGDGTLSAHLTLPGPG